MKQKSKFKTFILSFVPGLSHFYLGFADRGTIFLLIFGMICLGSLVLYTISNSDIFVLFIVVGVPIIWLVALIDAFSILNEMRYGDSTQIELKYNSEEAKISNRKIITLALSIIPGAGHMYLGYQKKGLAFMAIFFFTIFFMGWLNLSFLLFLLPLIWFYSFFDAFHTFNGSKVEDFDIANVFPSISNRHIGIGLIVIGIVIALRNFLMPILEELLYNIFSYSVINRIENYIQTIIASLIFIILGIRLLRGKKKQIEAEGDVNRED